MTTTQAAEILEVQVRTVQKYISDGKLTARKKIGPDGEPYQFISQAAWKAYLRTRRPVGHPPGRKAKKGDGRPGKRNE